MKNNWFFFSLLLLLAAPIKTMAQRISIVPQPNHLVEKQEQPFLLKGSTEICYSDDGLKLLAGYASSAVKEWTGLQPVIGKIKKQKQGNQILLKLNKEVKGGEEAYTLQSGKNTVEISASSEKGLFYGIQTLLQLIPVKGPLEIPAVSIEDAPRFTWRGMLFDNCRHIFSVAYLKKFIDQLAYHKLNKFHWHLTEDQGWRIEIKKYPRLQEVAAYRNGTQIGRDRKKDVDTIRYGGFYTQEQIKEVVAYAASRYVEVIPEIEMPGHSVAAITAYPHLACNEVSFETGGPFEVRKVWGVSKDLYCAGKDTVFSFLQDVFKEVMPLFPSKYIHIGGDEAPHDAWKKCPRCQQRIQKEGLKDEAELQSWFIRKMEKFLNANGKRIIGWEEIMQGGLTENATVHSWLGVQSGLKAAKMGHDVIMSPYSHLYIDGYQADPKIEPYAIGYWVPLDSVYAFEPVHSDLNEQEAKHILGAQGNLWTEFIPSESYFEYMVFPRIAALAEIDWTKKELKDFNGFKQRLNTQYMRYAKQGIRFRIPTPLMEVRANTDSTLFTISLRAPMKEGVVRYSIDGTEVTDASAQYQTPVTIKKGDVLRCAVFYTDGRKSSVDYFPKVKK